MRRWELVIGAAILVLLFSACSGERTVQNDIPGVVHVEIRLPLNPIHVGEPTIIKSYVTQDGKDVNNAQQVEFEYWNKDEDERKKVDATFQGDGIYTITQTFIEEGNYVVIAHVTARDMHVMPQKEFTVVEGRKKEASGR